MAEELRPDYQGDDNANARAERYFTALFSDNPPRNLHPNFATPGSYALFLDVANGDRSQIVEARAIAKKAQPLLDLNCFEPGREGSTEIILTPKGQELLAADPSTCTEIPPETHALLVTCAAGDLRELQRGFKLAQATYALVNQGLITSVDDPEDIEKVTLTEWGQRVHEQITSGVEVPNDGRFA